ncbi:MAG: hypothetical protein HFE78_05715 [Clostridiales bacterium]|nr:hypothetical protein [Clostridiales bacterium]
MGKGNRIRTERADERLAKKEAEKRKNKKARINHIITMVVCVFLIVVLVGSLIFAAFKNTIDKHFLHSSVSVSSENYQLNNAEMSYFFNTQYNYFLNQYGSMISYFNLDTTKSLKKQACTMAQKENYTWYDYFVDAAKNSIEEVFVLCEEAKSRGIALNDEDNKIVDETIEQLKSAASKANVSLKKYIEQNFGKNVTEEDVRNCATMQQLASKCYREVYNEPSYSDDAIAKQCEENMGTYYFFDYKSFVFKAETTDSASDEEKEEADKKASDDADALFKAAVSAEAFDTFVEDYYRKNNTVVADNADNASDQNVMTESKLKENVEKTLTTGAAYTTETDLGKWAFSKDAIGNYERKAGDVTIISDKTNNTYTVYYLVTPLYRHEYNTKNVRHILIATDTANSGEGLNDEAAKAKAEEILTEFKAGSNTSDAFGALAEQYTMDDGSKTTGGLYENVKKGQMVDEFEDWIYSSERQPGQTEIVKTSYGYHIMYFVGDGKISWQVEAEEGLRKADYDEVYTGLKEKYELNYNEKNLKKLSTIGA